MAPKSSSDSDTFECHQFSSNTLPSQYLRTGLHEDESAQGAAPEAGTEATILTDLPKFISYPKRNIPSKGYGSKLFETNGESTVSVVVEFNRSMHEEEKVDDDDIVFLPTKFDHCVRDQLPRSFKGDRRRNELLLDDMWLLTDATRQASRKRYQYEHESLDENDIDDDDEE